MSAEAPIHYGQPGGMTGAFQCSKSSDLTFTDIIASLRREVEAAGLRMLHEIDPQKVLQRGGHAIGAARQILFFHPDLMVRLLTADASALLEAPLKLAVIELPDSRITIRWIDPAVAFARYDNQALTILGQELAVLCEHIVSESLAPRFGALG
ncbi:DUF302 domain-containing protein [Lichenicola cladoniae]|uniref:DUF302 domain-containing protein n=1 Tax=Lichenicola cladoniae TaxID=1484109 RepID=A0A6M8HLP1_9PROT|nr:DUF302 domain-containing protein [Lichenicola cladoniae]NPD70161.1 DUF302 domain-containing protein [Acetobacteraceae bacterium]QKE89274.1 DUF302 domain-containing protein [Lichenicola cladoniae]